MKFKNWQDAQRSLTGKLLLMNGLQYLGLNQYSLHNLKLNEFERPYFDNLIDFNISHSGEYTICALSKTNKVGVDIEEIQDFPMYDFENQFTKEEWNKILQAKDTLSFFFTYWTQKEAFLKAIGLGLNIPLKNVPIVENKIVWNKKKWFLYQIQISKKYISHLSTDAVLPKIIIEKIQFD